MSYLDWYLPWFSPAFSFPGTRKSNHLSRFKAFAQMLPHGRTVIFAIHAGWSKGPFEGKRRSVVTYRKRTRWVASAELSMGPFYVTQSNPAHRLADPTQPNWNLKISTQPNPMERRSHNWRGQRNKTYYTYSTPKARALAAIRSLTGF